MTLPLEGLVVVDLTRLLPGPFATQLFADLGAEVIKVEDPLMGDYMRFVPPTVGETSYPFLMVNRNKKSVAVNLKDPDGQAILHKLVARADVFVEQFRAGVAERLGADPETLRRVNPKLVYCTFEGFGRSGPYAGRPAHDIDFGALSGILGVTGVDDGRPVIPGVPVADLAAGYNAAFSILAALRQRDRTGRGTHVDVAIFDTAVSLMVLNLAHYLSTGEAPVPGEALVTGLWPFYNVYETKDRRWLSIGAVESKFWERLVRLLGLPELAENQFPDEAGRRKTISAFQEIFRSKTLAEWRAILGAEDLPWAPVQTVSEVVRDPQVRERGMLLDADLGRVGTFKVVGHPAHHEGVPRTASGFVAAKGEHTEEVLRSLGYSESEIARLRKRGVIAP
ncbi:MAG TPA: CaiB/BaiF CoA-transferase family protein [Thermoplasmata archaeon]|nr:CaiB/BaiF CoA-transferase family protein [Thermoplasmata archaeon]